MSKITHGISTIKKQTTTTTPIVAQSGVHFIVGAAPVHIVDGGVNQVIMANSYAEAVAQVGYSNDWSNYDICEEIYSAFMLYKCSPIFIVNVLDPTKHKKSIATAEMEITEKQIKLPLDAIKSSVKVTGKDVGTNYEVFYGDENLIIEFVDDVSESAASVAYDVVDPSKITKADIIGGLDVNTMKTTGLELIDSVFAKYAIAPDIVMCPSWSHDSEVAAVMAAKCENINGVFDGVALIDVDTEEATHYSKVPEWKSKNGINAPQQILCYPMAKLGDKVFRMSTVVAGRMTATDNDEGLGDGTPCESPSNKTLHISSTVLANGSEVNLDLVQANFLNDNGVVTALNFIGGFVLWGNETACYPANTDITEYFICVSRMFKWVGKSVILSNWSKVDRKLNRRLIDSIVDSCNIWLNGLTAEEKILGGRIEFLEEENSNTDIQAGKAKFHIYLTPPSPAKELSFILEYDSSYLSALFA